MKIKHIVFLLVIFIVPMSTSFGADYYPELGVDPFYSSLNPEYVDEDETNVSGDTLLELIKDSKNNKQEKSIENTDSKTKFSFFKKNDKDDLENIGLDEQNFDEKELQVDIFPEDSSNDNKEDDSFVTKKRKKGADLVKELEKEEKAKQKSKVDVNTAKSDFSMKKLWPFSKEKKLAKKQASAPKKPAIEINAEFMEYFPERYEVEAVGDARVNFVEQGMVLSASKIIFNYDRNILTAKDNVVLNAKESITEGDFIKLDLNKPEGWLQNPVTKTDDIKLSAKEAFVYSDRIEEYDGVAKILKDEKLRFGSASFSGYLNNTVEDDEKVKDGDLELTPSKGLYTLKAKTILIEAKDDHEIITIKNGDLYFKKFKVASIPSTKIVSNKTRTNVETNFPEFGSKSLLGMHFGPAVVLNVPGGSTLKLAPIITYGSNDEWGFGAITRFRSENNMTEAAYGSAHDELLLRGKHKIAPGLTFNYSRLTSQSEWFFGFRKPKYSASLNYRRSDYIKDLGLRFTQMYIGGVFVDNRKNYDFSDTEGRFRWMTQSVKTLYKYQNEEGNISFSTGLVAQTAATVYTCGDVAGVFRVGPTVSTKVGPWKQTLVYYNTAEAGQTPFSFDRYRYGRNNIVLMERLRVCKYLSLGYLASLAMDREVKSDDLFQESRFLVSIGPEYAKVTIGYDARRKNTMFLFSTLVGTKDSEIEFKRSVLKNPDKFGKTKSKTKKKKKKDYKKYLKEDVK